MGKGKQKSSQWYIVQWATSIFVGIVFSAFILISPAYVKMEVEKYTLFRYIFWGYGILLPILLIEGVLIGGISLGELWEKIRPKTVGQYCLIAYFLFTVISAMLSDYPQATWSGGSRKEGVWTIGLYILTFYAVAKFFTGGRWIIYVLATTVFLFSLLSVIQLMGYNPFELYPEGYNYYDGYKAYSGAYIGTIGNVDFASGFLCIATGVLWFYVLRGEEKWRFLLLLPLLTGLYVLLRMQVLAGMVGFFVGTVAALPFVIPWEKKYRRYYLAGVGILLLAGVAVLFLWDCGEGLFHELHQMLRGNVSDSFGTGRIYIWRNVLERVPERLFFGTGPDTMLFSGIEPFQRYDPDLDMQLTSYIDAAHNEYLNILYHQGLLALLSYGTALVDLFLRWIKGKHNSPLSAVWGGACLCYGIQAFFNISQFVHTPVFWVCLGLLEYSLLEEPLANAELKRRKTK